MDFNFLGIAFVSDEIPKKKAEKIYEFMNNLIEKLKEQGQEELDQYLDKLGFESVMGVISRRRRTNHG